MSKTIIFSVYRYQILPISNNLQTRIDFNFNSIDELISEKNNIFREVILNPKTKFRGKGYNVLSKFEESFDDTYFLRMGVEKKVNIRDKDFVSKTENDYPNSLVYIDNANDKQYLLIEHQSDAFYKTSVLKNIIEKSMQNYLYEYGLSVYISKVTSISDFWETIMEYKGRIKSLRFNFIRPNMSNISGKAVEAIKILKNESNSHKTLLELNAPKNGVLENLTPDNQDIEGLAEYCSDGGGTPSIKITGVRKRIKTNKKEITIELDEVNFNNQPLKKVHKFLDLFLNNLDD
ncbi:MAG: hypothetical protein ABJM36_14655 [Algibacter sp.]|uniref:hypothetical protein n=1 Tax=Algibacter sp. TaxID=1872428 RepID=UPI0032983AB0